MLTAALLLGSLLGLYILVRYLKHKKSISSPEPVKDSAKPSIPDAKELVKEAREQDKK